MTIRDRGTIKWTAMMLPEHVAMVREVIANQDKVSKPVLDEQEIEEIERTISEGMTDNLKLVFTYWKDRYFETLIGRVNRFDQLSKKLRIVDEFEDRFDLSFGDIVDVRVDE